VRGGDDGTGAVGGDAGADARAGEAGGVSGGVTRAARWVSPLAWGSVAPNLPSPHESRRYAMAAKRLGVVADRRNAQSYLAKGEASLGVT